MYKSLTMVLCYIIVLFVGEVVAGKKLKLAVSRLNTADEEAGLVTSLLADSQRQTVLVDTGSVKSFFVWKSWYERVVGLGSCKELFWKCYDRNLPVPKPADVEYASFEDGTTVGIFPYSVSVQFGDFTKPSTKIGLICSSDPSPLDTPLHASLGLGPPRDGPTRFPSLMEQLMSDPSKPISENIFALYMNQVDKDVPAGYSGYLLLGEGDPSVYKAPPKYIPLIPSTLWRARLGFFHVGGDPKTGVVGEEVVIDTGTNILLVPQTHVESLLSSVRQRATAAAGTTVKIEWYAPWEVYLFDCRFLKFFPTLNFGLGASGSEVTVEVANNGYFLGESAKPGRCVLGLSVETRPVWYLPDTALVGNYFEFQPDKKRVGYAKVKAG